MGRKTKKTKTKTKRKKKQAPATYDQMPIEMPAKAASEKILIVSYDVSALTDDQRGELQLELKAQAESSDGHPDIPSPTFTLRTMRYERGERGLLRLVKIDDEGLDAKPAPATRPCCPKCGETEEIYVTETYDASHPIRFDEGTGNATVESAWNDTASYFGDGNCDYKAYCRECGHKTTKLDEFGLRSGQWDWS